MRIPAKLVLIMRWSTLRGRFPSLQGVLTLYPHYPARNTREFKQYRTSSSSGWKRELGIQKLSAVTCWCRFHSTNSSLSTSTSKIFSIFWKMRAAETVGSSEVLSRMIRALRARSPQGSLRVLKLLRSVERRKNALPVTTALRTPLSMNARVVLAKMSSRHCRRWIIQS